VRLGNYLQSANEDWTITKERATAENAWFTPEFINLSATIISTYYLADEKLQKLIHHYAVPAENASPKKVGLVMAGNIPLVGFHDLLCTFLTGHYAVIKLSSKDTVLIRFLVKKMVEWNAAAAPYFAFGEMLKGCDAYIATGSNNSSKYFEFYFNKYPHIIRKNRTSVAVLTGRETPDELESLADDVYQYFGLGCRNVTKIFVPENYNFEQLLNVFSRYNYLADHHKYRNNYDYNLAILLLNKRMYMSNQSLLLVEDTSPFSPISQLHYEYYKNADEVRDKLKGNETIQCVVGKRDIPFGAAQCPDICDFADGVDTVEFLLTLK
jgi:hypothetical protein